MNAAGPAMVLLLAVGVVGGETPEPDAASTYDEAVAAFNGGRIVEAQAILERLLRDRPDAFMGYPLYWNALGRVKEPPAQRAAVKEAVGYLEQVPPESRDEDYYHAYLEACRILSDDAGSSSMHAEAIARFPRGSIAQAALLDAARAEKDPAKSVAFYDDYITKFDDNISWTELAARDVVRLMIAHPDAFDRARFLAAAERAEHRVKRFVEVFGQPVRYVFLTVEVAEALLPADPANGLAYARKGLSYIQEQWPTAGTDFERLRYRLWPVLLSSHAALEQWQAARTVGDALSAEVDAESTTLTPDMESAFRRQYAAALERTDAPDEARVQRELAADPEAARRRREDRAHRELLGQETHRRAPGFSLKDLSGNTVRLADFRRRVLVLSLWATWCRPCVDELEELKTAFAKYGPDRRIAFAAVSIDSDKDVVSPFVEKRGYRFPILLSDGSVEGPFATQTIPRLFVIDRKGLI